MHRWYHLDTLSSKHFERPSYDTRVHVEAGGAMVEFLAREHPNVRRHPTEFVALDVEVASIQGGQCSQPTEPAR